MFAVERWNGRVEQVESPSEGMTRERRSLRPRLAPSLRPRQRGRLHGVLGQDSDVPRFEIWIRLSD